jgi:hypothetical protein
LLINGFVFIVVIASAWLILRAVLVEFDNVLLSQRTLVGKRTVRWAEVSDVQVSDSAVIVSSGSAAVHLSLIMLEPDSVLAIVREKLPPSLRDRLSRM